MSISSCQQQANALRMLAVDAVERAQSGHPGMPMGMADIAQVLWQKFLKHNPSNPDWLNRDRFILSNGHGSMLLYALLHLTGYDLTIDDLKQFRQLHSKTPGHPEWGQTPGIETTTGPLGQGLANGIGMALAERMLASTFNTAEHFIIDHYTYVFVGDGCLMEGISHEACSLAGTWALGKLIVFWDNNGISIDGATNGWFTEDVAQRFKAYGWQVIDNIDGHDPIAIQHAIEHAQKDTEKPSLLCCQTTIGYGAPRAAGRASCHGAPLGAEETAATRLQLQWDAPPFVIPDPIYKAWDHRTTGAKQESQWQQCFTVYQQQNPQLAQELQRRLARQLPSNWQDECMHYIEQCAQKLDACATRKASQQFLQALASQLPELIGGSADLSDSNLTRFSGCRAISANDYRGNYIHYGVREFAMAAIMNGLAIHGGFIPYGGTFLVFSDYARNAIRLSALMQLPTIYVLTHDSIGLGEDGPTHQPIEHINMLRMTPGLHVWRPCDTVETAIAWQQALMHRYPCCLVLSRQTLPCQTRTHHIQSKIACGAYILYEPTTPAKFIVIATGSEVHLAMEAAHLLAQQGYALRVVSMPCAETFAQQSKAYQEQVLPKTITKRIAIEAGNGDFWYRYVGLTGKVIGINMFGASAPGAQLFAAYSVTTDAIVQAVYELTLQKSEITL